MLLLFLIKWRVSFKNSGLKLLIHLVPLSQKAEVLEMIENSWEKQGAPPPEPRRWWDYKL